MNNGFDYVTVKNGRVTGFDYGVMLNKGTTNNVVENVQAQVNQEAGVALGQPHAPLDPNAPTIPQEPPPGLTSQVKDNVIRTNSIVGNKRGVWIANEAQGTLVTDNLIGASGGEGVWIERASQEPRRGQRHPGLERAGSRPPGVERERRPRQLAGRQRRRRPRRPPTTGTIVGIPSNDNVAEGNVIPRAAGPARGRRVDRQRPDRQHRDRLERRGDRALQRAADADQGQRRARQQGRHLAQGLDRQPHRGQRRERVGRDGHRARVAVVLERPPEQHLVEQHRRRHLRRRRDRRGLRDAHRRATRRTTTRASASSSPRSPTSSATTWRWTTRRGASGRARARTAASTSTAATTSPRATTARSAST